jgi:hypothetical protein
VVAPQTNQNPLKSKGGALAAGHIADVCPWEGYSVRP